MGFMLPRKVTSGLSFKTFAPASNAHQTSSWSAHKMSAGQAAKVASSATRDPSVKVGDMSGFREARGQADFDRRMKSYKPMTTFRDDFRKMPSLIHEHWLSSFTPEEQTTKVIGNWNTPVNESFAKKSINRKGLSGKRRNEGI